MHPPFLSDAVGVLRNGLFSMYLLNVTLCIDPSFTCVDFMFAVAPVLSIAVGAGNIPRNIRASNMLFGLSSPFFRLFIVSAPVFNSSATLSGWSL